MITIKLTVRKALNLEVLNDCIVHTGNIGLDNIVNSVSILDAPQVCSIEGDIVIISVCTLSGPGKKENFMEELFNWLLSKRLSAIIIQSEEVLIHISNGIIELAKEQRTPLIEITKNHKIKLIIKTILEKLLENEMIDFRYGEKINQQLMEIFIAEGLLKMLNYLSSVIKTPVYLYNTFLQNLTNRPPTENLLLLSYLNNEHNHFDVKQGDLVLIIGQEKLPDQILIPIRVSYELHGFLSAHGTHFNGKTLMKLKQAASICLLDLTMANSILKSQTNELKDMMERVLQGEVPEAMKKHLKEKNLNIYENFLSFVIKVKNKNPDIFGKKVYMSIMYTINTLLKTKDIPSLTAMTESPHLVVSFLFLDRTDEITCKIKWLMERLKEIFPDSDFFFGIGSQYQQFKDIKLSYDEACIALKGVDIEMLRNKGRIVSYSDLGFFKLLMDVRSENTLISYYKDTIEPILQYDNQYNAELIPTLRAYKKHMNIKQTAKELCVHRHTVRYRFKKINEILGYSFKESKNILLLFTGIEVWDYLKEKGLL